MSFLLCLAKLRRNLVLRKTPQETLLNTSVFGSSVEWKRTCSAFFTDSASDLVTLWCLAQAWSEKRTTLRFHMTRRCCCASLSGGWEVSAARTLFLRVFSVSNKLFKSVNESQTWRLPHEFA